MPVLDQDTLRARREFNYRPAFQRSNLLWHRPWTVLTGGDESDELEPEEPFVRAYHWFGKPESSFPTFPAGALVGTLRDALRQMLQPGAFYQTVVEPSSPDSIDRILESSRTILELEDDWDEQGASAYSESTWQRMCGFLRRQAALAQQIAGRDLPLPDILPGPKGSVDLHWKSPELELLVNIPAEASQAATFYGDDYGVQTVKGSLNPEMPAPGLVLWLLSQS